jgi:hypothetical protein
MLAQTRRTTRAFMILGGCTLYLLVQLTMIVRGHFVESKHFAFWMFPESTFFVALLTRETRGGREVHAKRGIWKAGTREAPVKYDWHEFVNDYRLNVLEMRARSKGTWADTSRYFQDALNYVAQRIPEDTVTQRLVLHLVYRQAGGEVEKITLKSEPRFEEGDKQ